MASARQFMLLAVNMPEHEPQVGQAAFSISSSSSAEILPVLPLDARDEGVDQVDRLAVARGCRPPSGRRRRRRWGCCTRIAPMNMPGTILSQLGMQIIPSKRCASIIVSTQSAMSSREGSEYFIPAWPIAMPSSTPIVLNRNGTPPAARTHSLTKLPDRLQVDVAGDDVDVAVADGDERLVPVPLADAGGPEQAAVGGAGVAALDGVGAHGGRGRFGGHRRRPRRGRGSSGRTSSMLAGEGRFTRRRGAKGGSVVGRRGSAEIAQPRLGGSLALPGPARSRGRSRPLPHEMPHDHPRQERDPQRQQHEDCPRRDDGLRQDTSPGRRRRGRSTTSGPVSTAISGTAAAADGGRGWNDDRRRRRTLGRLRRIRLGLGLGAGLGRGEGDRQVDRRRAAGGLEDRRVQLLPRERRVVPRRGVRARSRSTTRGASSRSGTSERVASARAAFSVSSGSGTISSALQFGQVVVLPAARARCPGACCSGSSGSGSRPCRSP